MIIGIKVPKDSDLPRRLRMCASRHGLQYAALLERWLSADEANQGQLFNQPETLQSQVNHAPNAEASGELTERLAALEARLDSSATPAALLESRLEDMTAAISSLANFISNLNIEATPQAASEISEASDNTPAPEKVSPAPAPDSPADDFAATVSMILARHAEGMTHRAIAAWLTAKGRLTQTGLSNWAHGSVSKIIKNNS